MTVALEARIEKCEKEISLIKDKSNDMSIQFARQDTKLDYIKDGLRELQETIKKLTEQPAKRWDSLITTGITCIVSLIISGAVTFVLTKH